METAEFNSRLLTALEEKTAWYDTAEMTRLLEDYRSFHSLVANLINVLIKKAVIKSDPYKHEKKISDISIPPDTEFSEADKPVVLGTRLSDFESMLDFICNYFKFSVATLTVERIKQLVALNSCFMWNSLTASTPRPNTRALAEIIISIRMGTDSLSISVVNDCVSHITKTITQINARLKDITDFQREIYKGEIRKIILENPAFDAAKATQPAAALQQIKKLFSQLMGKKPFYTELIDEILQEEFSPQKEQLQEALLARLSTAQTAVKKVEQKINPKELLLDALRTLAGISPQLEQVAVRIEENQNVLAAQQNGFAEKVSHFFRKMFGLKELPVEYKLIIIESATQTRREAIIQYQDFHADILRRARAYASFAVKKTPGYQKFEAMTEEQIAEYLTKQLSECQNFLTLLNALDAYFKTNASEENKSRIRGLKMEITSVKNTLVKTNQCRADYTAFVEEQQQMKKLGIENA